MDLRHALLLALASAGGLALGSLAAWAACRRLYGRQLQAAAGRLQKSEQARGFSQQQTMQARRQVETLKSEVAALQQAQAGTEAARQRARDAERARIVAELEEREELEQREAAYSATRPAGHGFADTQILP